MRARDLALLFTALDLTSCGQRGSGDPPAYLVYVRDREGSVLAAVDDRGRKVWEGRNDAFGLRLSSSGTAIPREFLDQELDEETGFYHFRHRYYDPATAQWITPDPKLLEDPDCSDRVQGCNPYAYAGNRPLEWTDPDGRWIEVTQDSDGLVHVTFSIAFVGDRAAEVAQAFKDSLNHRLSDVRVTAYIGVYRDSSEAPKSFHTAAVDLSDPQRIRSSIDLSRSHVTFRGDFFDPQDSAADRENILKHELFWHGSGNGEGGKDGYTFVGGDCVSKPGRINGISGNFYRDPGPTRWLPEELRLLQNPTTSPNQGLSLENAGQTSVEPTELPGVEKVNGWN